MDETMPIMVQYCGHDDVGRILQVGTCSEDEIGLYEVFFSESGGGVVVGFGDLSEDYVDVSDGSVRKRQTLHCEVSKTAVTADGLDAAIVSGVPDGATVLIGDAQHIVDDGELVLTFDTPGTYVVSIRAFPYRNLDLTLTATEI